MKIKQNYKLKCGKIMSWRILLPFIACFLFLTACESSQSATSFDESTFSSLETTTIPSSKTGLPEEVSDTISDATTTKENEITTDVTENVQNSAVMENTVTAVTEHSFLPANCIEPEICELCGETKGEPLGHAFRKATCTSPETCDICGETRGEPLGHSYKKATCTTPEKCSICGKTKGEPLGHSYKKATCTTPATCSICGATKGSPLGHNAHQTKCDVAEYCSVCGVLVYPAKNHSYSNATCLAPATCLICGKTKGTVSDHNMYEKSVYTKGDDLCTDWACFYCDYTTTEADKNRVSASNVQKAIMAMQSTYPTGTPYTNENFYKWNGGIYSGGYGCAGFAFMLSDAAFDNLPARYIYDINRLRIGDIIRVEDDTHSVIVTGIEGNTITIAEGNLNEEVYWGRTLDKSTLDFQYIMTRYSD